MTFSASTMMLSFAHQAPSELRKGPGGGEAVLVSDGHNAVHVALRGVAWEGTEWH